MRLIIGLGNAGEKYDKTRHNAGFMLIDKIVLKKNLSWQEKNKWQSFIARDNDTIYAKPAGYMNDSGEAAQKLIDYYKLRPKKFGLLAAKNCDLSDSLTIIHDEIDLPIGRYKISVNSRSAGHRGVESVIRCLKTKNFRRLRLGIANKKPKQMPAKDYVLARFTEEELGMIDEAFNEIISNDLI